MDKRKKFNKILLSVFLLLIVAFVVVYATTFQKSNHIRVQQQVIDDLYTLKGSKHENIIVTVKPLKQIYLYKEEVWCEFELNNMADEVYKLITPISSGALDMIVVNPKNEQIFPGSSIEYLAIGFEDVSPQSKSNKYIFSLNAFMLRSDIDFRNGIGMYSFFVNYQGFNSNVANFEVVFPTKKRDVYLYDKYVTNMTHFFNLDKAEEIFNDILINKESDYASKLYSSALTRMIFRLNLSNEQMMNQYENYLNGFLENFSDSPQVYYFIGTYDRFFTFGKRERREKMVEVLDSFRQRSSSDAVHSIIDQYLRMVYNQ